MKVVGIMLVGLLVVLGVGSFLYLGVFVLMGARASGQMARADLRKVPRAGQRVTWAIVAVMLAGPVAGAAVGVTWLRPGPTDSDLFAGEFKGMGVGLAIAVPIMLVLALRLAQLSKRRLRSAAEPEAGPRS